MADKFPGPYVDSVPQNLENPGPFIKRVPFATTEIGARSSVLPKSVKNDMTIEHTPNQNSKGS